MPSHHRVPRVTADDPTENRAVRTHGAAGAATVTGESDHKKFFDYYKAASESPETVERSRGIYDSIVACMRSDGVDTNRTMRVADIGCGAGTQSIFWARAGHDVVGLDINVDLVELAKVRSREAGVRASFLTGTADALPWSAGEFDVCIVPELLEHVENWEQCLDEVCRVVKPGGYVYLTTTNRLCPKQQEFSLPGYSWYPTWLKRKCLALARTTRKQWVEYAEYPAVNWFSPPELAAALKRRGYSSLDRFDVIARRAAGNRSAVAKLVASSSLLRYAAYFLTPYTMLIARHDRAAS
jgi:2-polyprenyl-6-hydroxyphenyl methylase/3-demethylubiquinone-9 3-methyltransferase